MEFSLEEIIANTNAYFFHKKDNSVFDKKYIFSILPREIKYENTVYIPVKSLINGVVNDHFLKDLERMAAMPCVCGIVFDELRYAEEKYRELLFNVLEKYQKSLDFVLMVPDTLLFVRELAFYARSAKLSKNTKIYAITGSVGKTSTSTMLKYVLKQKYKSIKDCTVENIEMRVAHRFLEVDANVDAMVFEVSGAKRKSLKRMCETLIPDGVIITKVTSENIGTFGSIENIAEEKAGLLAHIKKDGIAVIDDDERLHEAAKDYPVKKIFVNADDYELIETGKNGSRFLYRGVEYEIPVVGLHQIANAVKVIEFCQNIGVEQEFIYCGLKNFIQQIDRWVLDKYEGNVDFITDCPNNPSFETMMTNIKTFLKLYKDVPNKRLIISRIKSLGDFEKEYYTKIAKYICETDLSEVIVLDVEAYYMYEYIKNNSKIKTTFFKKPEKLTFNDPFIRYLIDTMNYPQVILLKAQRDDWGIKYGMVKELLRKYFKDKLIKQS